MVIDVTFKDLGFDQNWVHATTGKIVELVTEKLARELINKRRGGGCKPLADLAEMLLKAESKIREVAVEAIEQILPGVRFKMTKTLERKILDKLVEKAINIPVQIKIQIETIARVLQGIGIFICVISNRPPRLCACWMQIQTEVAENLIRAKVDEAFDEVLQ